MYSVTLYNSFEIQRQRLYTIDMVNPPPKSLLLMPTFFMSSVTWGCGGWGHLWKGSFIPLGAGSKVRRVTRYFSRGYRRLFTSSRLDQGGGELFMYGGDLWQPKISPCQISLNSAQNGPWQDLLCENNSFEQWFKRCFQCEVEQQIVKKKKKIIWPERPYTLEHKERKKGLEKAHWLDRHR